MALESLGEKLIRASLAGKQVQQQKEQRRQQLIESAKPVLNQVAGVLEQRGYEYAVDPERMSLAQRIKENKVVDGKNVEIYKYQKVMPLLKKYQEINTKMKGGFLPSEDKEREAINQEISSARERGASQEEIKALKEKRRETPLMQDSDRKQLRNLRKEINKQLPNKSALLKELDLDYRNRQLMGTSSGGEKDPKAFRLQLANKNSDIFNDNVSQIESKYGSVITKAQRTWFEYMNSFFRENYNPNKPDQNIASDIYTRFQAIAETPELIQQQVTKQSDEKINSVTSNIENLKKSQIPSSEKALKSLKALLSLQPYASTKSEDALAMIIADGMNDSIVGDFQYLMDPDTVKASKVHLQKVAKVGMNTGEEGEKNDDFIKSERDKVGKYLRENINIIESTYGIDIQEGKITDAGGMRNFDDMSEFLLKTLTSEKAFTQLGASLTDETEYKRVLNQKSGPEWEYLKLISVLSKRLDPIYLDDKYNDKAAELLGKMNPGWISKGSKNSRGVEKSFENSILEGSKFFSGTGFGLF